LPVGSVCSFGKFSVVITNILAFIILGESPTQNAIPGGSSITAGTNVPILK
jgi:uncharacterized membrane protein